MREPLTRKPKYSNTTLAWLAIILVGVRIDVGVVGSWESSLPITRLFGYVWTRNSPAFRAVACATAGAWAGYGIGALGERLESWLLSLVSMVVMIGSIAVGIWALAKLSWFRQPFRIMLLG
jgi:hypothetical protein